MLCVREDRVRFPRGSFGADFRKAYDLSANFESRICPLSTLGAGHAGLVKKGRSLANILLMESGSLSSLNELRCEVRGLTTDQGTEKGVSEATVEILQKFRGEYAPGDPMSFMYPRCLWIPGHLHVMFNALEEAVKGLSVSKAFLDHLRALQQFLSDKQLRRTFQASCLAGKPCFGKFSKYRTVHIDWRWEFLSKALDHFIPHVSRFEAELQCRPDPCSRKRSLEKHCCWRGRKSFGGSVFLEVCEMLRMAGKAIEGVAHKLEGCWCHEDLWTRPLTRKRKIHCFSGRLATNIVSGKVVVVLGLPMLAWSTCFARSRLVPVRGIRGCWRI